MGFPVFFRDIPHLAIASGIWPRKRIVVGKDFYKLEENQMIAVLMHEVGHCKNFHLEERLIIFALTFWIAMISKKFWYLYIAHPMAIEQEMEADNFVAKRGMGRYMISVLNQSPDGGDFHPDFLSRKLNIEKVKPK